MDKKEIIQRLENIKSHLQARAIVINADIGKIQKDITELEREISCDLYGLLQDAREKL